MEGKPLGFEISDLFFTSNEITYSSEPKELYHQLVSQLLEIERAVINVKMIPFLTNAGVCETIISFITRVPEDDKVKEEEKSNYFREREISESALKKSFNAVYLIINRTNSGMKNFITNSPNQYLQLLLRAFTPQSNANFNHIKLILAWSMENFVEFKKLLYSSDFIPLALNYLHEPSVIELLLAIISNTLSMVEERENFHKKNILSTIIDKVLDKENEETSKIASEFLSRLLQETSSIAGSEQILSSLNNSSEIVDKLIAVIVNESPIEQQKSSLLALSSIHSKIHEKAVGPPGFVEAQNNFSCYKEKINIYLSNYIPQLCEILSKSRNAKYFTAESFNLPSYSIKSALSSYRLQLIEIITQNVEYDNQILSKIPDSFWNTISSWYFDHCNNSIFLLKVSRLFQSVIFSNNDEVFKKVTKSKILTKMIENFNNPSFSACKCFSLLIFNQLRLYADAHPTGLIKHYLQSHGSWSSFLPNLRKETELQCSKSLIAIKSHIPQQRPPPLLSPYALPKNFNTEDGIDLGSPYAISIGIETLPNEVVAPPPPVQSKKKKKKKKKANNANNLTPPSPIQLNENNVDN